MTLILGDVPSTWPKFWVMSLFFQKMKKTKLFISLNIKKKTSIIPPPNFWESQKRTGPIFRVMYQVQHPKNGSCPFFVISTFQSVWIINKRNPPSMILLQKNPTPIYNMIKNQWVASTWTQTKGHPQPQPLWPPFDYNLTISRHIKKPTSRPLSN